VVLVLTQEPSDNFLIPAGKLRDAALAGKANVIAVGLTAAVSDSTLQRLSTVALRILKEDDASIVECFEWLARVVDIIVTSLAASGSGQAINLPPLPPQVAWLKP
jgi:hypothetical protein